MPKDIKHYSLALVLFIVGGGLGFFVGKNMDTTQVVQEDVAVTNNSLYTVQSAIIRGVVNSVNGKNLNITNQNNNITTDIVVSDRVVIANPNGVSSDPSTIQIGKPVVISLEMIDGEYQAVSIQYITPAPSLPAQMPM